MSKSVYEMVTDRIIEQLENGVIPWKKPWNGIASGAYNRITKKPYSLLNQMLLKHTGEYATFKQWTELGGHIRKGEKSEILVFWKILPVEEKKEDGTTEIKQIAMLRYYNVFHISQIDGIEPLSYEAKELSPLDEAEKVISDYLTREHIVLENTASNEAYYSHSRDLIHLPLMEQFQNEAEYYSTAFHELTHSTGHKNRLDRLNSSITARFGSEDYSKEELVAEIGSANLMNILGIQTTGSFRNSTAYIQNWLSALRSDVKFIVSASCKAEKAVKYILNEE
ncbi:ArdC family protein [Mediterraneibacter gnavus]|jgi:antirestriction protein ArdC|uniref:ArdC family protein n=1 Tax=Mediterraneibacter gnavus TaxID=33038 RepID=UPI000E54A91B|nr:zincin-like metallopeptidase domain-containing protein [Mediterraneibacter gnavus]RHM41241.1 DUF1738 domain-containing protein [Mediterraneibacter gnavus]